MSYNNALNNMCLNDFIVKKSVASGGPVFTVSNTANSSTSSASRVVTSLGTGDLFDYFKSPVGSTRSFQVGLNATLGSWDVQTNPAGASTNMDGTAAIRLFETGIVYFLQNDVFVSRTSPGGLVRSVVLNNGTTAHSDASFSIAVAAGTSGDPYMQFSILGEQVWTMGCDNSDGQKFKLSSSNALGSNDTLTVFPDSSLAQFSVTTLDNSSTVSGSFVQVTSQNLATSSTSSARLVASSQNGAGDAYVIFDPHANVAGSRFEVGQTQADLFQISYTTDTTNPNLSGTISVQANTSGLVSLPQSSSQLHIGNGSVVGSASLDIVKATIGGATFAQIQNTDTSNADSHAILNIFTAVGGGDPKLYFNDGTGGQDFAVGVDQSAAGTFKISRGTALGANDILTITPAGLVALPNADSPVGLVVGSGTIGTNDTITLTGNGSGTYLQFSVRAPSGIIPAVNVISGDSSTPAQVTYSTASILRWSEGVAGTSQNYQLWSGGTSFGVGGTQVLNITPGGTVTATAGDIFAQRSQSSGGVQIGANNLNTGNNASARLTLTTSSLMSGSDAYILFDASIGSAGAFEFGHVAASNTLEIQVEPSNVGPGMDGTPAFVVHNSTGIVTKPLQPRFYALAAVQPNVTGDATSYTVTFNGSITYNVGNTFDGTSTFTAPVNGLYLLTCYLSITNGLSSGSTDFFMAISVPQDGRLAQFAPGPMRPSGNIIVCGGSLQSYMTAGQQAHVMIVGTSGLKTIGVDTTNSFFAGTLLS